MSRYKDVYGLHDILEFPAYANHSNYLLWFFNAIIFKEKECFVGKISLYTLFTFDCKLVFCRYI